MKTIENLYNEIISCPSKWIYWKYDDTIDDTIKNIIPDFSSMYNEGNGEKLIMELLRVGNKAEGSLVDNVKLLTEERKRHIVSLFFIGHMLYDKISVIRDSVNSQIDNLGFPQPKDNPVEAQELFSFLWILLCLFHDLGYAYEEGKVNMENIEETSSLEDIYLKLSKEFNPLIYSIDIIKKYDKYRLCKWGVKDHGIWGGRVFDRDMSKIKDLLRQTEIIDNTSIFCTEDVDHIYAFAAWIIISHNLCFNGGKDDYSNCYRCQHLDDFIKRKARCISLRSNPLLFLFCLADTLEPTKKLKSSRGNQHSMNMCKLLELDFSGNKISFNLSNLLDYKAGDDYKKTILSMNDWLIDVSDDLTIRF